jgi:hypothetical protein
MHARTRGLLALALGIGLAIPLALAGAPSAFAGPVFYTVSVTSSGGLSGGSQVTSASRLSTGRYEVIFNTDVTQCAYIGSITEDNDSQAITQTAQRTGNVDGVFVETRHLDGSHIDASFTLDVRCAPSDPQFAVINSTGSLARGKGVTSTQHLGTGKYEVAFNRTVTGCAYTATTGTTGAGTNAGAAVVFTASGHVHAARGVFVETKSGSGALTDQSFHLAVTCGASQIRRWGVFKGSGALARGSHITAGSPVGTGDYSVTVDSRGGLCTYTAAIGATDNGTEKTPGTVDLFFDGIVGNTLNISVLVRDLNGDPAALPVHLVAVC